MFRHRSADYSVVAHIIKEFLFWLILPGLVAAGSAALVWMLMQARMQLLAANFKTALAHAEKEAAENRPRLEDLLAELRLERRQFLRKTAGFRGSETTVLTLERLCFRQVPLTGWMQEEIPLGGGEPLPGQTLLIQPASQPDAADASVAVVAS
jgi:hypothetical protein